MAVNPEWRTVMRITRMVVPLLLAFPALAIGQAAMQPAGLLGPVRLY